MTTTTTARRILLVDDDRHVTDVLGKYVEGEGYEVGTATSAGQAATLAKSWDPDLIVLDLMLPDARGMEPFSRIRAVSQAPIIMLTACDEEVQKIVGLEIGADDYVTKPFSPREVLARIKNVLRRSGEERPAQAGQPPLAFGDLTIDREGHEVNFAGKSINVTPTEYRILELLASRPGRIFSRSEILDALNADPDVLDRTLDKHVTNLRRKLDAADPDGSRYIQTVYGVGYKMRRDPSGVLARSG